MAFSDRFVLGERVGIGATGEVFRAFDKERGVDVAVKRLHEHLVADPFSRERFRCETALSARIHSEHVVRCLDGGVDDEDRPYLVLEWLGGQDLSERLKASRLSTRDALEITRQAALGLQAIHDAGIIHRDVKPRNLFVAQTAPEQPFVVKLLDLGVAYDTCSERPEGVTMGTPFYMSPEQAQGVATVGTASDLFSLGALLFELLTGRRPFVGPTTYSLLAKIALQATPRLGEVWPDAPSSLDAFIYRALARDPGARFFSASEMADELSRLDRMSIDGGFPDDPSERRSCEPNPEHLVAVIFGRLPLSPYVVRLRDLFRHVVQEYQGSAVNLLGRGVVAVFHGECADAVLRAADTALSLTEYVDGGRWALASEAMLPPEIGLPESIIERGVRILERARCGANEASIRIDDETASLLEEHYVIEGTRGALSLRAVRSGR